MLFSFWYHPATIIGAIAIVGVSLFLLRSYVNARARRRRIAFQQRALGIINAPDMSKDYTVGRVSDEGCQAMFLGPRDEAGWEWHKQTMDEGFRLNAADVAVSRQDNGTPYLPARADQPYIAFIDDTGVSNAGYPVIKGYPNSSYKDWTQVDEEGNEYLPIAGIAFVDGQVLDISVIFLPYIKPDLRTERHRVYAITGNDNERQHAEIYRSDPMYYGLTTLVHSHPLLPRNAAGLRPVASSEHETLLAEINSGRDVLWLCVHGAPSDRIAGFISDRERPSPIRVGLPKFEK